MENHEEGSGMQHRRRGEEGRGKGVRVIGNIIGLWEFVAPRRLTEHGPPDLDGIFRAGRTP